MTRGRPLSVVCLVRLVPLSGKLQYWLARLPEQHDMYPDSSRVPSGATILNADRSRYI